MSQSHWAVTNCSKLYSSTFNIPTFKLFLNCVSGRTCLSSCDCDQLQLSGVVVEGGEIGQYAMGTSDLDVDSMIASLERQVKELETTEAQLFPVQQFEACRESLLQIRMSWHTFVIEGHPSQDFQTKFYLSFSRQVPAMTPSTIFSTRNLFMVTPFLLPFLYRTSRVRGEMLPSGTHSCGSR